MVKISSKCNGLTLIETVIAIAVIAIAALGSLQYLYFGALQTRVARLELIATRTAQLLLEDWKSTGGDDGYNPVSLGMGFTPISAGNYRITIGGATFYINLPPANDIDNDEFAGVTLRRLTATLRWRNDGTQGIISDDDPSLVFTTYVRRGQD